MENNTDNTYTDLLKQIVKMINSTEFMSATLILQKLLMVVSPACADAYGQRVLGAVTRFEHVKEQYPDVNDAPIDEFAASVRDNIEMSSELLKNFCHIIEDGSLKEYVRNHTLFY